MSTFSGSVPLGRSRRRGLVSCVHSLKCRVVDAPPLPDLEKALHNFILGFYDQAIDRLPSGRILGLLDLLATGNKGGSCLGLLDPVSNIILNTIALLPEGGAAEASTTPPATKKSNRLVRNTLTWHGTANSLLAFLMVYFGCLAKEQAARYLYWADADLRLAVMLVQHDLYLGGEEAVLDPESDRTQAALEWAATMAGHPSPTGLARLMSSRLKDDDFHILEKLLFSAAAADAPLKADDVVIIDGILRVAMSPPCVATVIHTRKGPVLHVRNNLGAVWSSTTPSTADDIRITSTALGLDGKPISSLQCGLPDKLQRCLGRADGLGKSLKTTPCSSAACDYLQSLKMHLHGTIHNFCIKALKLPTPSGSLMRAFLMAGHCYGPMDPVSNIIVNSIWYYTCGCPLPESGRSKIGQYNDVMDPLSLLLTQVRSLKGLVKLAAFAGPQFSTEACALELLCSARCNVVDMLPSLAEIFEENNPFHEAAKAAGHPLPLQLGELHHLLLLMPDERSALVSLVTEARTGRTVLRLDDMIIRMRHMWLRRSAAKAGGIVQAPELFPESRTLVSSMRSNYEERRSWLRSKIEQVLKDYTT